MATDGVPPNTFAINVSGIEVTGIGRSEEEARADAIRQISNMLNQTPVAPLGAYHSNPVNTSQLGRKNEVSENMIGKLQEYCQANYWPLPTYTLEKVQGPSHLPNFSMKCQVHGFTAVGSGSNKKEAKQNAAKLVYSSIAKYTENKHNESKFKNDVRSICSSTQVEDEKNSEKKPPNTIIVLPHAIRARSGEQNSLIIEELPSTDTKSAAESCGSSDDLRIPPDLVVLNVEETKKIFLEKQPEQKEERPESGKPLELLDVEDVLASQLENVVISTGDTEDQRQTKVTEDQQETKVTEDQQETKDTEDQRETKDQSAKLAES